MNWHSRSSYFAVSLSDAEILGCKPKPSDRLHVLMSDAAEGIVREVGIRKNSGTKISTTIPTSVLVCPIRLNLLGGRNGTHLDVLMPLWIPARLIQGQGEDLGLEPRSGVLPWIDRRLLGPVASIPPVLADVADVDRRLGEHASEFEEAQTWKALWKLSLEMLVEICPAMRNALDVGDVEFDGVTYRCDAMSLLVPEDKVRGLATPHLRLYQQLGGMPEDAAEARLYRTVCGEAVGNPVGSLCLPPRTEYAAAKRHLGHMGSFSLGPSQRRAMHHALCLEPGDVLAVTGPPGTGKTTLIQSLVASAFVGAAVDGAKHPPIVVVSSTNNQAVTNAISSLEQAGASASDLETDRWLPAPLSGYGLYCPSQSQADKGLPFQLRYTDREGVHGLPSTMETEDYVSEATRFYLDRFRAYAGTTAPSLALDPMRALEDATKFLQNELRGSADGMATDILSWEAFLDDWRRLRTESLPLLAAMRDEEARTPSVLDEALRQMEQARATAIRSIEDLELFRQGTPRRRFPWPFSVLADLLGRRKRAARNRAFLALRPHLASLAPADASCSSEILRGLVSMRAESAALSKRCEERFSAAQSRANEVQARITEIEAFSARTESTRLYFAERLRRELSFDLNDGYAVLSELDTTLRRRQFDLAGRYWEGRWLLEMNQELHGFNFGSEPHPKEQLERAWRRMAMLTPCIGSTLHMLPRNFQAWSGKRPHPLLGFIDMLVLDEAGQVAPEIAAAAFGLAKRAVVVGDAQQLEPVWLIPDPVDSGNMVRAGLTASAEAGVPDAMRDWSASGGSAMRMAECVSRFNREGARGLALVEHRRCRPEIGAFLRELSYPDLEVLTRTRESYPLPPFACAHVPGISSTVGGSRWNQGEAEAVANWVEDMREDLENAYGADVTDIVAVVTPFASQGARIRSLLAGRGIEGLRVGTVHTIQGADSPVVLFSPVYGGGDLGMPFFFDRSPNMLNVAVSRAKDSFVVVGNLSIFDPNSQKPSGLLARYLFRDRVDSELGVRLGPGVSEVSVAPELVSSLARHRELLTSALRGAEQNLVVVSPFLSPEAIRLDGVDELARDAVARGVRVQVVCDGELGRSDGGDGFDQGVEMLRAAGVDVDIHAKVHTKLLVVDGVRLALGSFNWLSASRSARWARHETSMVFEGEVVREWSARLLEEIGSRPVM